MKQVIVVDQNDCIIGYKNREDLLDEDIVRVSVLNVKNSLGETLLAKRAFTKKNNPGEWGPAVAGMNEKGQTYKSNIIMETLEEIGYYLTNIDKISKMRLKTNHDIIAVFFETIIDDKKAEEFVIDKREIQRVKWFSDDEIRKIQKRTNNIFLKKIFKLENVN